MLSPDRFFFLLLAGEIKIRCTALRKCISHCATKPQRSVVSSQVGILRWNKWNNCGHSTLQKKIKNPTGARGEAEQELWCSVKICSLVDMCFSHQLKLPSTCSGFLLARAGVDSALITRPRMDFSRPCCFSIGQEPSR